jgi:tetratricopeptide (TPR) repeat protein
MTLTITSAGRAWPIDLARSTDFDPRLQLVFLLQLIIGEGLLGPSPTVRDLSGLGNLSYAYRRFNEAIELYARALAADPSTNERRQIYRSLASVYEEKSNRAGALKYWKLLAEFSEIDRPQVERHISDLERNR